MIEVVGVFDLILFYSIVCIHAIKPVSNPNPKTDQLQAYQFPSSEVPLAQRPLTVRVRQDIDEFIRQLPNRNEWLRQVITEAAEAEQTDECGDCA